MVSGSGSKKGVRLGLTTKNEMERKLKEPLKGWEQSAMREPQNGGEGGTIHGEPFLSRGGRDVGKKGKKD